MLRIVCSLGDWSTFIIPADAVGLPLSLCGSLSMKAPA